MTTSNATRKTISRQPADRAANSPARPPADPLAQAAAEAEAALRRPPRETRKGTPRSITIVRLADLVEDADQKSEDQLRAAALEEAERIKVPVRPVVVASISAEEFDTVAAAGGIYGLLEVKHGPGRYRALWLDSALRNCWTEEFDVVDLTGLAHARRARDAAAYRDLQARKKRERQAEEQARREADARAWVERWARWLLCYYAENYRPGAGEQVLRRFEEQLLPHAPWLMTYAQDRQLVAILALVASPEIE